MGRLDRQCSIGPAIRHTPEVVASAVFRPVMAVPKDITICIAAVKCAFLTSVSGLCGMHPSVMVHFLFPTCDVEGKMSIPHTAPVRGSGAETH
ncbi:hypothetical protein EVAR_65360_1 [Eumeta japonica]|uniref:Uncharacterized protein n=1 Tax=Eumeta variegata TaxID=151549 RepID=A0A4C1ZS17_EUMVA|nr:hypothetical protein EVAR_65360_1 [Eumeta japonica]